MRAFRNNHQKAALEYYNYISDSSIENFLDIPTEKRIAIFNMNYTELVKWKCIKAFKKGNVSIRYFTKFGLTEDESRTMHKNLSISLLV